MCCSNLDRSMSGLIYIHWLDLSLPFVFPGFSSSIISISHTTEHTLVCSHLCFPTLSFSFMQLIDTIFKNHLFIYGCAGSLLLCRLSLVAVIGSYSSLWRAGFSLQLLHGMQDLPGSGIKPMSPVLVGGFLTTGPPGKS